MERRNNVLDINPRDEENDNIPVGLLNVLNQLEDLTKKLAVGLSQLQHFYINEIGTNLDGRLSAMAINTNNLAVNNAGEIYAIARLLEKAGITTVEEIKNVKTEEFDKPLAEKQKEFEEKMEAELRKMQSGKALDELGIVPPSASETKAILESKV